MEYRVQSSGEVLTQGQIRKLNSNTSLPKVWDANVCSALGIDPVFITPKPEITGYTQAVRDGVTQDANGNWVQAWTVVDMFSDYTDDEGILVTKTDQENDYQARLNSEAAASVRTQRDAKLAETDWMVIKSAETGVALATEWATYRQALRDITTHANFPYLTETDWPTKPE
jgi:hypothetical protein